MPIDRTPPGSGVNPPTTVVPSTRVTVASAFSSITIHEPHQRVRSLAQVVVELADQRGMVRAESNRAHTPRASACLREQPPELNRWNQRVDRRARPPRSTTRRTT